VDTCRPSFDIILPEFTSWNDVVSCPLQDVFSPKRWRKDSNSFLTASDIRSFFADCLLVVFLPLLVMASYFVAKIVHPAHSEMNAGQL